MRVNKSRKNMESVMGHQGFGDMTIIRNGMRITIPQRALNEDGSIPKDLLEVIKNGLTIENAVVIHRRQGVIVEKAENYNLGGM